jgi:DUF4097 and DUF4098 domain-containing protein YvlB
MIAAAALVAAGAGTARAQQQVNESRTTGPTGSVEIHGVAGEVRVVGWDRNQVQVTGTLSSPDQRVRVDEGEDGIEVRMTGVRGAETRGASLVVRVPSRKDVEVNAPLAAVIVEGIDGNVEAQSTTGPVTVSGGRSRQVSAISRTGPVSVTADADRVEAVSMSGPVTVAGTVRDHVEASSVSGGVRVTAAAGSVEANSVSGSVEIASMRGRAEVHSVSGGIRVTGRALSGSFQTVSGSVVLAGDLDRGSDLELTSHSGDVTLQLAPGASADVEAGTFTGDIVVDVPGARVERESRRSARIRLGSGDATVKVTTFSGDVKLTHR